MSQKYLKIYNEHSNYTLDSRQYVPNVSHCREEDEVHYENDGSGEYLTFKILSDGTIGGNNESDALTCTVFYSLDDGDGLELTNVSVRIGDTIKFKATNNHYSTNASRMSYFTSTCNFNIFGNIQSMILGDDFETIPSLDSNSEHENTNIGTYAYLFYNTNVISAKNLYLPKTPCYGEYFGTFYNCSKLIEPPILTRVSRSYDIFMRMFQNCTSLIEAPKLPNYSTTSYKCFSNMFEGCTNLLYGPKELPATSLGAACYAYMFKNCNKLKIAPILPASTLSNECYQQMFYGCSSLNHITCLATDISATDCTKNGVSGVAATGTFVKDTAMENGTVDSADGIPTGGTVKNDLNEEPLTFEIVEAGNVGFIAYDNSYPITLEYKKNDDEWISITSAPSGSQPIINVISGDILKFRAPENTTYTRLATGQSVYNYFKGTATFNASGNIMSLLNGTDFSNMTTLSATYTFYKLFVDLKIIDASKLILPATTLTNYCYFMMFSGCRYLTKTPILSAKTLKNYCYARMFEECSELTSTPKLPATTLAGACYKFMFSNCTKLIQTSTLPATSLQTECYDQMFYGCSKLTTTPTLSATTMKNSCYNQMFAYCTSLTTVSTLPATTLANYCYFKMFDHCTNLTTAPELPATTLSNYCYNYMFDGCTSLNYVKCLATTNISNSCTGGLRSVSSSGTFVKNASATWPEGINGIPTNGTVETA